MSRISLTAPSMSDEEFQREQESMTAEERIQQVHDVYGVVLRETTKSVQLLETELNLIETKDAYETAMGRCPNIVNDGKILFLRTEDLDAKRAASRLVRYWEERVSIFGERAFGQLSSLELTEEELNGMDPNKVKWLRGKDKSGRSLIFIDWEGFDPSRCAPSGAQKVIWIRVHQALYGTDMKERGGLVFIVDASSFGLQTYSRKIIRMVISDINESLPLRRIVHICNPHSFFRQMLPKLRFLMGKRMRNRVFMHSEQIDQLLEMYGIPTSSLPDQILPENAKPRKLQGLRNHVICRSGTIESGAV